MNINITFKCKDEGALENLTILLLNEGGDEWKKPFDKLVEKGSNRVWRLLLKLKTKVAITYGRSLNLHKKADEHILKFKSRIYKRLKQLVDYAPIYRSEMGKKNTSISQLYITVKSQYDSNMKELKRIFKWLKPCNVSQNDCYHDIHSNLVECWDKCLISGMLLGKTKEAGDFWNNEVMPALKVIYPLVSHEPVDIWSNDIPF